MEPINTISEWARPYIPKRPPSLEKIISTAQKEFKRLAPLSVKKPFEKLFQYKAEVFLATVCTALFFLYMRKTVEQIETIPIAIEDPTMTVVQFISTEFETLKEAKAEAKELLKLPLVDNIMLHQINEKIAITAKADQLFTKLRTRLILADINQDTLKLISQTPCTFCVYEFISQFLNEDFDPETDLNTKWLNQILIQGALNKQSFSGYHSRVEDLEEHYKNNGKEIPLFQPTPDGEADIYPPSDCRISSDISEEEYTNHLKTYLNKDNSGLVITVRDRSIACARKNNKYYLFESHNPLTVEKPSILTSKSFVLPCETVEEMGEFLSHHHYPPRKSESQILCRFIKLLPVAIRE